MVLGRTSAQGGIGGSICSWVLLEEADEKRKIT